MKNVLFSAGCQTPQPNPDEKAKREQVQKCRKQIHEEIKAKMQTCVAQKVPNFKFPENQWVFEQIIRIAFLQYVIHLPPYRDENQRRDREPDHHFGGGGFGGGGPGALNKACPDEKSRAAARDCFRNMFQNKEKNGPLPQKERFEDRRKKVCDARKTCLNQ